MTRPSKDAQQLRLDYESSRDEARQQVILAARRFTKSLGRQVTNYHVRGFIHFVFNLSTLQGVRSPRPVTWSIEALCDEFDLGRSAMQRVIRVAEQSGIIAVHRQTRGTNSYSIDEAGVHQWLLSRSSARPPVPTSAVDREVATQPLEVAWQPWEVARQLVGGCQTTSHIGIHSSGIQVGTKPPPPDRKNQAAADEVEGVGSGTSIGPGGSPHTRGDDHPRRAAWPAQPAERCDAAGQGWSRDERRRVLAALEAAGVALLTPTIAEAQALGFAAAAVVEFCDVYRANAKRFRGPGAILFRLRKGEWPADGVRSIDQTRAATQRGAAKRAREELETRLFVALRELRAAGLDEAAIRARLAEALPIEFLRAEGWA